MKFMQATASTAGNDEQPLNASAQLTKVAVGMALLTILIFLPVVSYNFVNYDDDLFTTNNPKVAPGLTWEGVNWAFTSASIDYWRPLSWLSHMADIELFGAAAGFHHLTSLLIHAAASVMLLLALHRLTGAVWESAMVAALFAWHPLHVESVVWIAERKDVLCGFFWFYTIWAYARYVELPGAWRYAQVLLGFGLGVMSKPMIVTLPCVLLLLDFWPLHRIDPAKFAFWKNGNWRAASSTGWSLLKEKLPLFAMVLALSMSTMISQRDVGTMSEHMPLFARVINASLAYVTYLRQTFWPADLCVLYPLMAPPQPWQWAGALLLCVGLTVRFLFGGRRFPFLTVGWLWFIGALVPVIGLVQVGEQAHADRYTYVPLVGLFLLLVWGAMALAEGLPRLRRWLPWAAISVLLTCAILTRLQLRHWENSLELFKRAIAVDPSNVTAHNNVAAELMMLGKAEDAIPYLEAGLKAGQRRADRRPGMVFNLGVCSFWVGDYTRAQALLIEAFSREQRPKDTADWINTLKIMKPPAHQVAWQRRLTALALATVKDYSGAAAELTEVIRLEPQESSARIDKAAYLAASGQDDQALALLQETVQAFPSNALARSNLGGLLARKGRSAEAFLHYRTALELSPTNPDTRHNFALALARSHKPLEAKAEFEEVLRLNPNHQPATQQLAWLLATSHECRDAPRSVLLARKALTEQPSATSLDVMAAASAANGSYQEAIAQATQALQLARTAKLTELETAIYSRLQLYQTRQPYTQRPL